MFHSAAVNTTSAPPAPPLAPNVQLQYHSNRSSNNNPPTFAQVTRTLNDCQCVIVDQRNTFQRLIAAGQKVIAEKNNQNKELHDQIKLLHAENAALLEQKVKVQAHQAKCSESDNNIDAHKNFLRLRALIMSVIEPSTTVTESAPLSTATATQQSSPPVDIEDIERQFKIQQHKNEKTRLDLAEARMQLSTAEKRLTDYLNDSCNTQSGSSEDELQQTVQENGMLFEELQATRKRGDQLIERCFQLEEEIQRYAIGGMKRLKTSNMNVNHDDYEDRFEGLAQQQRSVLQQNHRNRHMSTTTTTTATINTHDEDQDNEEMVQWPHAPHYEVLVNRKVACEAFVANNTSVSFIREDVVRRAGLKPNKLNSPARFKCWGGDNQTMIVVEDVVVPMKIGKHRGRCPMFVSQQLGSEMILGANWLKSERVYWMVDYMLIGPNRIRVDPKPPVMVRKSDPRAQSLNDGPVIIERLN